MNAWIVTISRYSDGDASALRDRAFARLYKEEGFAVKVLEQGDEHAEGQADGIFYVRLPFGNDDRFRKILHYLRKPALIRRELRKWETETGAPDFIKIAYDDNRIVRLVRRYGQKNGIPVIFDANEWYSPCEFISGERNRAYRMNDAQNRKVIRAPMGVIAISSYLENWFSKERGLRTVRIPVILDVNAIDGSVSRTRESAVRLIYAGSPGGKDALLPLLAALTKLPAELRARFRLTLAGIDSEQLKRMPGLSAEMLSTLSETVIPLGRVPHARVEELLKESDFSVLFRPAEERYAKAGFPTKAVEAMAHGTAMLLNLSSDLGKYLKDGENAVVSDSMRAEDVEKALLRIAKMTEEEILSVRRNARRTAEAAFDYRLYKKQTESFLTEMGVRR